MTKSKVGVIDIGCGNVSSVYNLTRRTGYPAKVIRSPEQLQDFDLIILPGVGAFDTVMSKLVELNFVDALNEFIANKDKRYIGICLGMQVLANSSEEGSIAGLGWIDGSVKKFSKLPDGYPIPHMGWNKAKFKALDLEDLNYDMNRFYFVHSYYFSCDEKYQLSTTDYGGDFTSAVYKDNIYGFQFHPEKSGKNGMNLFKTVLEKICV